MKYDEIIQCPKTGGDLCYKIEVTPEVTNFFSLSCGFWTNTLMKHGEPFYEEQLEGLPEIYKDIMWVDEATNLVWLPIMMQEKEKGMLFAEGKDKDNWKWAAVPSYKIPHSERKHHPVPGSPNKFMDWTTNMEKKQTYEEGDFIEAMEYLGFLQD